MLEGMKKRINKELKDPVNYVALVIALAFIGGLMYLGHQSETASLG